MFLKVGWQRIELWRGGCSLWHGVAPIFVHIRMHRRKANRSEKEIKTAPKTDPDFFVRSLQFSHGKSEKSITPSGSLYFFSCDIILNRQPPHGSAPGQPCKIKKKYNTIWVPVFFPRVTSWTDSTICRLYRITLSDFTGARRWQLEKSNSGMVWQIFFLSKKKRKQKGELSDNDGHSIDSERAG